jgi:predicted esterase
MKSYYRVSFFALLIFFTTCSEDDETPVENSSGSLVKTVSVGDQTASTIKTLVAFSGYDIDASIFKYDVEIFKVEYRTKFQGKDIVASGLVIVPETDQSISILSYQHGTIVLDTDAPSEQASNSTDVLLYSAISSAGFIAVIPDMVGFGSSNDTFHPYYVQEPTARAISDMIVAASELAEERKLNFDGRLFLAGYSQGGYATMATHKLIESEGIDGITLVASFPAAGGFDLKGVQEYLFAQSQYADPYYLAYLVNSYELYYQQDNLLNDFFNEPYASRISGLFDGTNSAGEINAQLTKSIKDLISDDIRIGIDTQTRFEYVVNMLNENSLVNQWYPRNLMYVYHGLEDSTVPYENSKTTYQKLLSNGASADKLHLVPLQGDHSSSIKPYIEDLVPRLMALK